MPHSRRTDKEKDKNIMVRVSGELHEQFRSILKQEDKNQSEVIRDLIRAYIKERRQKSLF